MDDLTDEQRQAYWRYNITLTTILIIVWFVAAYIVSGLLAGWLVAPQLTVVPAPPLNQALERM